MLCVGKTFEMRVRKPPNHASLGHHLFLRRRRCLVGRVIRKHVTSMFAINPYVVPVRQNLLKQLSLHLCCVLGCGLGFVRSQGNPAKKTQGQEPELWAGQARETRTPAPASSI